MVVFLIEYWAIYLDDMFWDLPVKGLITFGGAPNLNLQAKPLAEDFRFGLLVVALTTLPPQKRNEKTHSKLLICGFKNVGYP